MTGSRAPFTAVFVIKTMSKPGGGAERVLAQVTSALAARGHDITIVSRDEPGSSDYYSSTGVKRVRIGGCDASSGVGQLLSTSSQLREVITALLPQVAIGFMHSSFIPLGLGLIGTGISVLASEHTVMAHYSTRPSERLALLATPWLFDAYTIVSEQARRTFPALLRRKMHVVPNPLAQVSSNASAARATRHLIVSVGRLDEAKDHATLISAFSRIADRNPLWDLKIAGDGVLRSRLQKQIRDLGLENRATLLGPVRDIGALYAQADLFATASRYESFGLATAEALQNGVPAIGFADCPGTNELIVHEENGLLVQAVGEREIAFASALEFAIRSNSSRWEWATRARTSVARFEEGHIVDIWERLLSSMAR